MADEKPCSRRGKWIGGCRFEERADLDPPDLSAFETLSGVPSWFVESLRRKTYVRDVCVTCGRTIERTA